MNTSRSSLVLLLTCLGSSLTGCGVEIEDRLLSVDAYHVEFKPSRGDLTPAARAVEADAWRAQVRAAVDRVAQTVTAANVYGDEALWNPILTATNATTTRCKFTNNSARSLSVTAGQGDQIREASIQAALLNSGPISGVGSCNMSQSDRLRAFDLIATSFPTGVPTSNIQTLDVRLGTSTSADPWGELDFATFTVTPDATSGTGASQFAFVVVDRKSGWQNNFKQVLIVTRGSYFGQI